MAVARLDVLEAVELLRRSSQRLREENPVGHPQRQLAAAGLERRPVDADQVAQVQPHEALERLLAEDVRARVQLQAARAIGEVDERRLAVSASGRDAPRHPVARVGLLARLEPVVRSVNLRHRPDPREGVREGVDARLAEPIELGPSIVVWAMGLCHRAIVRTARDAVPTSLRSS